MVEEKERRRMIHCRGSDGVEQDDNASYAIDRTGSPVYVWRPIFVAAHGGPCLLVGGTPKRRLASSVVEAAPIKSPGGAYI